MKILILSFYYPPDLCAGSFRAEALVKALRKRMSEGLSMEVITTYPNRYGSFARQASELDVCDGLTVRRVKVPKHQSGMVGQSKAFACYARGVLEAVSGQSYDLIYATSSRLMTATLGAWLSKRMNTPLYLDIRDIFVDTIKDVLSPRMGRFAYYVFSMVERWTVRRAVRVNLVSGGFLQYFRERYPGLDFAAYTNGIDEVFVNACPADRKTEPDKSTLILYAGNMGDGQGLHTIIPEFAMRLNQEVEFLLVGDGGRRVQLEKAVNELANVKLRPPVGRDELIQLYSEADILFLHLNDYDAFRKVLPSKIFEYGASGKPVLAGVAGYAAEFIETHLKGASVFPPGDPDKGVEAYRSLQVGSIDRREFVEAFLRPSIMDRMAKEILSVIE